MGKKSKELSQAEIWDDSALVDSWNEAYEEYKFYHSIHARGEKVRDVLKSYERGEDEANKVTEDHQSKVAPASEDGEIEDGAVEPEVEAARVQENLKPLTQHDHLQADTQTVIEAATDTGATPYKDGPRLPHQLLAGTQDPALKNLMMSWYWAGYYSGFYEGQQKASGSQCGHDAASSGK